MQEFDPKKLQIRFTSFLEKNTTLFMKVIRLTRPLLQPITCSASMSWPCNLRDDLTDQWTHSTEMLSIHVEILADMAAATTNPAVSQAVLQARSALVPC